MWWFRAAWLEVGDLSGEGDQLKCSGSFLNDCASLPSVSALDVM